MNYPTPEQMFGPLPKGHPDTRALRIDEHGRLYVKAPRTVSGVKPVQLHPDAVRELPMYATPDPDGWTIHEPGTLLSFGPHREYQWRFEGLHRLGWHASDNAVLGSVPDKRNEYRSRPKSAPELDKVDLGNGQTLIYTDVPGVQADCYRPKPAPEVWDPGAADISAVYREVYGDIVPPGVRPRTATKYLNAWRKVAAEKGKTL